MMKKIFINVDDKTIMTMVFLKLIQDSFLNDLTAQLIKKLMEGSMIRLNSQKLSRLS
jgi:hypothetical protein